MTKTGLITPAGFLCNKHGKTDSFITVPFDQNQKRQSHNVESLSVITPDNFPRVNLLKLFYENYQQIINFYQFDTLSYQKDAKREK